MQPLPRLAVGSVQQAADTRLLCWGLLGALGRFGHVQHFFSRAEHCSVDGARPATGLASRQLDSWLMSAERCRWLFQRAMHSADLAVVEGRFVEPCHGSKHLGGRLDVLCRWLDLPRVAVLDARQLGHCHLPPRPPRLEGVLLDRVSDPSEFHRLQTSLEALWGVPVLGGLEALPRLRDEIESLPCGSTLSEAACDELVYRFLRLSQPEKLQRIAAAQPLAAPPVCAPCGSGDASKLTIAVAYDEAFCGYFVDTLELLESQGATVIEFSPLHDEEPPAADVIYFGCGHPERHAEQLADNQCMALALRRQLCAGTRIFAEGGGMAYLCQQVETPLGQRWPMVGILPAVARASATRFPLEPVELTLSRGSWIGGPATQLRGYRNPNWQLEPAGALIGYAGGEHRRDLVGRYLALGTRLQLHFAAQPHLLGRFFKPHAVSEAAPVAATPSR